MTEIRLPNTITTIGTFRYCSYLEKINLPNGISSLPQSTFLECVSLKNITLPNNLITIGDSAFRSCSSLRSVVIPASVLKIGWWAFYTAYSTVAQSYATNIYVIGRASAPAGYDKDWYSSSTKYPVYITWNATVDTYTFVSNGGTNVDNKVGVSINQPTCTKDGFYLVGWYNNPGFAGSAIAFPYSNSAKTTLYAKWSSIPIDGLTKEGALPLQNGTVTVGSVGKYYSIKTDTATKIKIGIPGLTGIVEMIGYVDGESEPSIYGVVVMMVESTYNLTAGHEYIFIFSAVNTDTYQATLTVVIE
jgi:hypothetical protein